MKRWIVAAAAIACACSPPPARDGAEAEASAAPVLAAVTLPVADDAGNRMEALTQSGARWCTSDGAWCLEAEGDTPPRVLRGAGAISLPGAEATHAPWNLIVRTGAESALVGVVATDQQMYSGGSASAEQLILFEVRSGAAREVARLPLGGRAEIRACFDADDETQRAGACKDEYSFVTRISLGEGGASGAPRLLLETAAGSYPGRVTRSADSLARTPLSESDLVWAADETCSYRRTYARGADGAYAPDQPLPACSDYLEP